MKKNILIAMLTLLAGLANAETPKWTKYIYKESLITQLADDDKYIWTILNKGLLKLDKTTGDTGFYLIPGYNYSDIIFTIVTDDDGNKWIGTSKGLVKYDGMIWTTYNKANSGLPNDTVTALAIDKNGNKWICTLAGLSKFDGTKCTTYKYVKNDEYDNYDYNDELDKNTYSLAIDKIGNVWLLSMYGLIKFDGANWTTYMYVCTIFECQSQACDNNRCATFNSNNSNSLIIDRNGLKWICDQSYGIIKFDDTTWTTYNLVSSISTQGNTYSTAEDSNGTKWVATYDGLVKFENEKTHFYNINNSDIPSNHIYSLLLDKKGNKWIGGINAIFKFDSTTWTNYNLSNQILPGNVKTIAIDEADTKWIGTDGGLVKYDGNWTTYNKGNTGLPINDIRTLVVDKNGDKWIGTNGSGLVKFDGTNWIIYNSSNSDLPDNTINAISIDDAGIKWIGTNNGLVSYDGTQLTTIKYIDSTGFYGKGIGSIAIDKSGNKWVGVGSETNTYQLKKYDGTKWTKYPIGTVNSIAIDENGLIWIGTWIGLVKFDGTNSTTYDQSNSGLLNNYVSTISTDGKGNLWIGIGQFNSYLSKFDGADFTNFSCASRGFYGITSIEIDDSSKKWIACGNLFVYDENGIETLIEEKTTSLSNQGLLFPNPASGRLSISKGADNVKCVEIFNSLGCLVKRSLFDITKKIDISDLKSGMYFVKIKTNEGYRNEKLVVK
jgi:ligand-binding sensor domain-containing protein